jgi:GH25 family lysozyme M1 (1,4-beta-N-acetylmuramidase)
VLYTNHDTAKLIALKREDYPLLSRLPLWYARYKPEIKGVFPMGHWENYFLWQFSSIANCDEKACPMRIDGAQEDIDVNATGGDRQMLARAWSRGELLPKRPPVLQYLVSAKGALGISHIGGATFTLPGGEQAASETETAQYFR